MPEDGTKTEFNIAIASLQRLHELLKECNEYSRFSRVPKPNPQLLFLWRDTLSAVYSEICPKLSDKEKDIIKTNWDEYQKVGSIFVVKKTQRGSVKTIDINRFVTQWQRLQKIEITLRIYADAKGMLIPNKPSTGRAIAEME